MTDFFLHSSQVFIVTKNGLHISDQHQPSALSACRSADELCIYITSDPYDNPPYLTALRRTKGWCGRDHRFRPHRLEASVLIMILTPLLLLNLSTVIYRHFRSGYHVNHISNSHSKFPHLTKFG